MTAHHFWMFAPSPQKLPAVSLQRAQISEDLCALQAKTICAHPFAWYLFK